MTKKQMTREEGHDFYADPASQTPQGPGRRRRGNLREEVPVRFDVEPLDALRAAAEADDRSVSSWIRRAVEYKLDPCAG